MKQSTRTRNRLREHPDLTPEREGKFIGPGPLSGRLCVLLRGAKWAGWLPADEVPERLRL